MFVSIEALVHTEQEQEIELPYSGFYLRGPNSAKFARCWRARKF